MGRHDPPELHMPVPTPAAPASTAAAALGRRLSKDRPTFITQPSLFHPRPSVSKPPRTPSPRSNPESSTETERPVLSLHHPTSSAALVGPVAPDSPPFNTTSPEDIEDSQGADEDGIIHVDNRTRSLSNGLNLPASPPTPAPSPIPRGDTSGWQTAHDDEDEFLRMVRAHYMSLDTAQRQRFMGELINISGTEELRYVTSLATPRLKVDFLKRLPMEIALRVPSLPLVGLM